MSQTFRVPWTARRSNQSILKEINPEYSLEGLMLNPKLQYFGHQTIRVDSLEKTLILVKIEGNSRKRWQRVRCLDINGHEFVQLWEIVEDRETWHAAVHGSQIVGHYLLTYRLNNKLLLLLFYLENTLEHFLQAILMVLNSFSFVLVWETIFPSILNDKLARQSILGWKFFTFSTLNISCHSILACRASVEKSVSNLMGFSLYTISCFCPAVYKIVFIFCHFTYMSWCGSLWIHFLGGLCAPCTQMSVSFSRLEKFSNISLSKSLSPSLPLFSICNLPTPTMRILVLLMSQSSLKLSFLKILFFYSDWVISTILCSRWLMCPTISSNLLSISSICHFIYCVLQY